MLGANRQTDTHTHTHTDKPIYRKQKTKNHSISHKKMELRRRMLIIIRVYKYLLAEFLNTDHTLTRPVAIRKRAENREGKSYSVTERTPTKH